MLFKKNKKADSIKWRLIGLSGKLFIDFLFQRSKIHLQGYNESLAAIIASRRCIFAFWHSRILLLSYYYKKFNASIMVSQSEDGEIISQILNRQGQTTIRGSTRKGGMRALIKQLHDIQTNNKPGVVIPDGPQGPRHKVQPGVILLSQKSGFPIVPITYSAKRRKVFQSWDQFILPMPWTSCIIGYGNPIWVPRVLTRETIQLYSITLENELNRISLQADKYYEHQFN
jgi:lysophospholipid acyltransferase (LPLAT)-like uncharacterized protein